MQVRSMALALPLALGAAGCQTSSTQSEGRPTASAPGTSGSTAARDPMVKPGPSVKAHAEDQVVDGRIARVTGRSLSIESDRGETQVLELAPQTTIVVDGEDATHAELREGQPVRASFSEVEGRNIAVEVRAGELDREDRGALPYGTSGSAAARDPMVEPGPSVKGHAEDQVVDGHIASVSGRSISIESDRGETEVLELAPQTTIRVDGEDATQSELREGQPVRASFSEVEGRNVAVEVRAGELQPEEERASPYGRSLPLPPPADAPFEAR